MHYFYPIERGLVFLFVFPDLANGNKVMLRPLKPDFIPVFREMSNVLLSFCVRDGE